MPTLHIIIYRIKRVLEVTFIVWGLTVMLAFMAAVWFGPRFGLFFLIAGVLCWVWALIRGFRGKGWLRGFTSVGQRYFIPSPNGYPWDEVSFTSLDPELEGDYSGLLLNSKGAGED